jgi:alkylation response protein AidB-like acyl-CoA dehydrogenase
MAQLLADRRDVDFVLHEQFRVEELSRHPRFAEFTRKTVDMIVGEARSLAVRELMPLGRSGDVQGCRYENRTVTVPDGFRRGWDLLREGGWFAPAQDPEWGGQGIPHTVNVMAQNYLLGANLSLLMVAGLNHGAGAILERFGSDGQKRLFLERLYTGEWGGTMALTEPGSGSNLGDLTTSASRQDDGTFLLSGNKIFISGGDHDMTPNIVHLVLARIEGAPAGSRGISLFIVPKVLVDENGNPGEPNDIVCTGIEEKMGLHGSPTCSMALGTRGRCVGFLVGRENQGLAMMFVMMNKARLMVGSQGLACASSAFLHALDYARTRIQGTLPGPGGGKPVAIAEHPDVRRMLLTMKLYTEGMRSLLCLVASLEDRRSLDPEGAEGLRFRNLMDILTPIAKGYVTDRAVEVCNLAIQVFGGYGYTREFPVEQLARDVRITTIYEGTNGIQAMDLVFRKLAADRGRLFQDLCGEIRALADEAAGVPSLSGLAGGLGEALEGLRETAARLGKAADQGKILDAHAFACPFLEVAGDVVMGWMLLWRALIATRALEGGCGARDTDFYQGQVMSARFFLRSFLPVTLGRMASIRDLCGAPTEISDRSLGGR